MDSLKGHLLVASARLQDTNFHKSVLLMVQHDEDGALGLIVNRPLEINVKDACEAALETPCNVEGVLHQGGPCEGPLMVVHTAGTVNEVEVLPGVYFSTERDNIEWLLENGDGPTKFFVGYAGWGPGQLEAEVETGSWLTTPATRDLAFAPGGEDQWSRLMTRITLAGHIDPDRIPDDPSMN